MPNLTTYKINEMFETIQGEGFHTGVPSIFVRLQGCPVGCPWCDTKHTWEVNLDAEQNAVEVLNKTQESEKWFSATSVDILDLFQEQGYVAKHVVITGGEPCMYDLTSLTSELIEQGYSVQIETSGTFEVKAHEQTWVTLSGKVDMPGKYDVLQQVIDRANEFKHPIAREMHIEQLEEILSQRGNQQKALIYLQPISQQKRATELAVETCIKKNWRLSLQTHKFIGIE
ncbi:7-carboxy-7-deazaguanine synthase QueE [Alteromonadaceae bacterium M269]|nr:7-carboxy-7-deazaguanine synthase QueE [Alteromonadaceae bacterium M269]